MRKAADKTFDLVKTPLQKGVTLLEASAGTGKTYSLAGLILRLVAEEFIPIREILAVTYTIAATAELKERVRERLHQAATQLRSGKFEDALVTRLATGKERDKSLRAIEVALTGFDEAQVFTIHSFCQRVLHDYAFESGAGFDSTLVPDTTSLFQQIAEDFWRLKLSAVPELVGAVCLGREKLLNEWLNLLLRTRNHPDLVFIPSDDQKSFEELTANLEKALADIKAEWASSEAEVTDTLRNSRNLSRNKEGFNPDRVAKTVANVQAACGDFESANPLCFQSLQELTTENIQKATRPNYAVPKHRFFDLCTDFARAVEALLLHLTHGFHRYAEEQIVLRKDHANIVSFDDLILNLRNGLRDPNSGSRLAQAVGASYQAVLVDEFQDTDPAQYEIFRRVFGAGDHHLYYIGDPKQAIYGFRGADVFTYIAAIADANRRFKLGTNYRSEARLVDAINLLCTQVEQPFVLRKIGYRQIEATGDPDFPLLTRLPQGARAPLSFRLVPSTRANGSAMNKAEATEAVCQRVAADMNRFVQSKAQLGQRPAAFGDMAVLVRTHRQAEQIHESLRRHGIRSIVQSDRSVFASAEAAELERFLKGVLEPARETLFKGALTSSLVGLTGDDLVKLDTDEQERQRWIDKFFEWRDHWSSECFIASFRQIVVGEEVRARVIQVPAGERVLTNFLHLAELLHIAETAQRLRPDGLVSWLGKQRKLSWVAQDESQLRLESDTDAVQIVTIHKAKGLEYPIVFCPFLWTPADSDWWDELQFHDRHNGDRLTFSLRGKEAGNAEQRAWATEEAKSEEARMLYVAITRAKNRCTIHLPEYQQVQNSSLALLFEESQRPNLQQLVKQLAKQLPQSIAVSVSKAAPDKTETAISHPKSLSARKFQGSIDRTAMIASFTGLNTDRIQVEEQEPETTDASEVTAEEETTTGATIFDFARGARAGVFFHAVLERLDFAAPDIETTVDEQLVWHGFAGNKCRDAIVATLKGVLERELEPKLTLRQITQKQRLSELEFFFRLRRLDPKRLAAVFSQCEGLEEPFRTNLERLRFDPVEGFLHGFIDLFFESNGCYYLIDWKSNWLGNRAKDYDQHGMKRAMAEANYLLQSHLYVLAADLLLSRRITNYSYERDFGGVFYVFLRGIVPGNIDFGVFRHRPSANSISALRQLAA